MNINKEKLAYLAREYDLSFVILHGSYARGTQRKDSDIDIAVVSKTKLDFQRYFDLNHSFSEIFDDSLKEKELDFKSLGHADPLFRYEVVRDGVLLYGNEADYEEYKAVSARMYEDARPLFELERTLALKYRDHLREKGYDQ